MNDDAVKTSNNATKETNHWNIQEAPHIYEELIKDDSDKCSKAPDAKDEIIFDAASTTVHPPAYRTNKTAAYDNDKYVFKKSNDYVIEDHDIGSGERCQKADYLLNNHTYNKLIHCHNQ